MLEASSVYYQYVNERAAHVKNKLFPVGVNLGHSKSPISLVIGCLILMSNYEQCSVRKGIMHL